MFPICVGRNVNQSYAQNVKEKEKTRHVRYVGKRRDSKSMLKSKKPYKKRFFWNASIVKEAKKDYSIKLMKIIVYRNAHIV